MAKPTHGIRRFKVRYLIPNEEAFRKVGFGFSKVDDGYEVFSLPEGWTKKKNRYGEHEIRDGKGRVRAVGNLGLDEYLVTFLYLFTIVSIGAWSFGDECTFGIVIDDFEHKISKEDYIHVASFTEEESKFEKASNDFFKLFQSWWADLFGYSSEDDDTSVDTELDVEKIKKGFQKAVNILDKKLPGWRTDLSLYWD